MARFPAEMLSPKRLSVVIASLLFAIKICALGATDTITWGGDNTRAGYQTYAHLFEVYLGELFRANSIAGTTTWIRR
jgi:hypothetical protein